MNDKSKLNIIMFNMSNYSDWQKGLVNRNYHVLHNLAKKDEVNKILAVDFLPFNWKRGLKVFLKDQILKDTRGSIVYGDLISRCWQISSKVLVYSTLHNLWRPEKIILELKRIIAEEAMENNLIVWNYNPFYTDYFNQFNQVLNIFDAVENWALHSSYEKYKRKLIENYQLIKEKSDLILTVSQTLKKELFDNLEKVHWLPNAVDLDIFNNQTQILEALNNIPRPRLCFLGILNDRLDDEILLYLAKKNPDKSIILAGPIWPNFPQEKYNQLKNVYFLGKINFNDIPKLYNGIDSGIVPYKITDFIKTGDSMKYYELIATNLPIVTTKISGTERFGQLLTIANTPQEFNQAVNNELNKSRENFKKERDQFLETNNWQYRTEQMLELIYEKL